MVNGRDIEVGSEVRWLGPISWHRGVVAEDRESGEVLVGSLDGHSSMVVDRDELEPCDPGEEPAA